MSWSLPTITAKTKQAATAKALAAFLTQTAEQTGHDADRTLVSKTIASTVNALQKEPGQDEQYVVTGNGHVTGGYSYERDGERVTAPVEAVTLTVSASVQKIPTPQ